MNRVELLDARPRIVHEARLSSASLKALMRNEILAIRIPKFLSLAETEAVEHAIREVGVEYYVGDTKADTQERKGKIGPNLYRFKNDIPAYFERARSFERHDRPRLFKRIDVPGRFFDALRAAHGPYGTVEQACSSSGGPLSTCTVRDLPSAPPHFDWIRGELPHFDAFSRLTDQFAWNIYVSVGQRGGATLIYGTQDPAEALAMDTPSLTLPPQRGDLLLFRARNVHAVEAAEGERLTVSGFWGPTTDERLLYWI